VEAFGLNEILWPDGSVSVVVSGVVDDTTVERFEAGLHRPIDAGCRRLIVDISASDVGSAGLAALNDLERRVDGRSVVSLVASGVGLRTLQIVGLTARFRTYESLDAAVRPSGAAVPRVAAPAGAATPARLNRRRETVSGDRSDGH